MTMPTRLPLFLTLLALLLVGGVSGPAAAQPGGFGDLGNAEPVTWSLQLSQSSGRPGDRIIAVVTADISRVPDARGKLWHIYPREGVHTGNEPATEFEIDLSSWDVFHFGDIQWPEPETIINALGEEQPAYEGVQRFYIPIIIDRDAEADPIPVPVNITVKYAVCATNCRTGEVTLTKGFTVLPADADPVTSRADEEAFAGFDTSGFDGMPTTQDEASALQEADVDASTSADNSRIQGQLFGYKYDFAGTGLFAILLAVVLAFVGGTVLNLMPCVLPIIPIKIMGLTQASHSRAQSTFLGAVMLLGVVSFWLALGAAVAMLSGIDSVNSLFQRPWFGISVGLFILIMAAGMMGAFAVGLPQWVYRVNPKHDSPVGAFGFGVMAAVLSTPCTAPFMGSALAWAATQESTFITIAVFVAIGLGMGWPYLVLAAFPKLVEKVPRTGPASELVKQVLGLMLVATAVFFIGTGLVGLVSLYPYLGAVLHWWVIVIIVGLMALWLAYRTFQITPSAGRRVFFTAAGALAFAGVTAFALAQTHSDVGPWEEYKPETYAQAREDGRITIVEFTAVW